MIGNKLAVAAVLLMASTVARAAEPPSNPCMEDATFLACFQRLYNEQVKTTDARATPEAEEHAAAGAEAAVAKAANSSDQTDAAVSIKDFLPGLVTALGLGELSEDDSSQTLANNWNPGHGWALSTKLVRQDGTLFEPLKTALAESLDDSALEDRVDSLEAELGDFDDTRLEASLSFEGKIGKWQFGRGYGHYDELTNRYFEAITAALPAGEQVNQIFEAERVAQAEFAEGGLSTSVATAIAERPEAALRVARELERRVKALASTLDDLERTLQEGRYYDLAQLIGNQPQLYGTTSYRYRDGAAGPERWDLAVHFEYGFRSFNGVLAKCGDGLADNDGGKTCLANFLAANAETKSPNRITASLEYSHTDDFDFPLPDDDFAFHLDSAQSWIIKAGYGRSLRVGEDGADILRAAFEGSYEDISGEPTKQSRLTATATLTQRVTGKIYASLSAVWAEKPEYRGDVDEELSARAGLKWKLSREELDN